ncbi:MAG: AEC family transporter, partial [Clostridia bacterium]|nr:AEC family transporter [Clostridia bacterium]
EALSAFVAKKGDEQKRGMIRFCTIFANNGFLGIPLSIAVFGASSPAVTVLIVMNVINNIMMYTMGIYLVSGDKTTMSLKKAFLNPVLIAFCIGVALNLINVSKYLPEAVTFAEHFSNTVTPLAMTVLGMKMGGISFLSLFRSVKTYYVSFLKLVAVPVFIVGVLFVLRLFIPAVNDDVILGSFIAFAMPTAGLSSLFADHYGGDTENAVAFTLGSTVLSVVAIPLLYWALTALL